MIYTNENHTFVICAYKEGTYLEGCILSLLNQTVKSNVIIATSTPNDYIYMLAQKYNIKVIANENGGGIGKDFNFALKVGDTELVTICHHDDYYYKNYLQTMLNYINKASDPIIFFSNYYELRDEIPIKSNTILKVKRLMICPLKFRFLWSKTFVRKLVLSFGNPICCPSVTFCKSKVIYPIFDESYKTALDYVAWLKLAHLKGEFVYCPTALMQHRIHIGSETTETIQSNIRSKEELEIFESMWPKPIARLLAKLYGTSQKSNDV